jgi:hypothetical protein
VRRIVIVGAPRLLLLELRKGEGTISMAGESEGTRGGGTADRSGGTFFSQLRGMIAALWVSRHRNIFLLFVSGPDRRRPYSFRHEPGRNRAARPRRRLPSDVHFRSSRRHAPRSDGQKEKASFYAWNLKPSPITASSPSGRCWALLGSVARHKGVSEPVRPPDTWIDVQVPC